MKNTLLFAIIFVFAGFSASITAQETITGYTFPTGDTLTDIYPNLGLPGNSNYYVSAEDTTGHPNTVKRQITFTDGATDFAATASGWDNGMFAKLWSIKFKAEGFIDLKVSSKQYSDDVNPGPRDFQVQARMSGEDWVDIGSPYTLASDWTSGVVNEEELPDQFDNPGSTSLYIRWIMTTNMDINGNPVEATGISKIDDIIVTGTNVSGIEETLIDSRFSYYPNPVTDGILHIEAEQALQEVIILDVKGKAVMSIENPENSIDISTLGAGVYFIQPLYAGGQAGAAYRLIVQ